MSRELQGVGISLRGDHYEEVLSTSRRIDWLEVQPENFATSCGPQGGLGAGGRPRRVLDACRERYPIVPHGVSFSVGGPDPFDRAQVDALDAFAKHVDAPYVSEHVSYSCALGVSFHNLLPLPFSRAAAAHVAARAIELEARLTRPLVLENITYYATMPGSEMTEGQFLTEVLDAIHDATGGGGLLLDVNNVYVNARNHGLEPLDVLMALPLGRTRQIHLAGHRRQGNRLIDDHGSAVSKEVWALYEEALRITGPVPTLIEWENNLPSLDRIVDEADHARALIDKACNKACRAPRAQQTQGMPW